MDVYDVRAQALIGSIGPAEVDTHLREAITRYNGQDYRLSSNYWAQEMRTRAAVSITRLLVLRRLDRSVLLNLASLVLSARPDPFGSSEVEVFANLALDRSLHEQIVKAVAARAKAVRSMRTSAEEKLSVLTRFARLLLPISDADASALFNEAVAVTDEVDFSTVHQIALFAPLAEHAVASMDANQRRAVGRDLAIVVGDAGIRLAGYDHFPWEEAAQALTTLDVCLALAAIARWEDSGVVRRSTFLPSLLKTALSCNALSPAQVSCLSALLDQFSVELINRIIEEARRQRSGPDLRMLAEDLAREELLRFGRGTRQQVNERLTSLHTNSAPGFWLDRLAQAVAFHQMERSGRTSQRAEKEYPSYPKEPAAERPDPLDSLDWTAHRFVSVDEIDDFIGRALAAAQASKTFVAVSTILDRMGSVVAVSDRASHLEALSQATPHQIADYELAQALARRIKDWHGAPAVSQWCRGHLLPVVVELLPGLSRWLALGESALLALLETSDIPGDRIAAALLEGVERHVDALDAPMVYALVGLIGRHCEPNDVAQLMARYGERLVRRIPAHERDHWDLTDVPTEPAAGLARFIYALMGDVDVGLRWRAAHALRRLAYLGDVATLDRLVGLYGRTSEPTYRKPDVPFYWLAARLWLVMTLDRIAAEAPSKVGHLGQWLFEIAGDDEFPHVLVRSFAKSAVYKLIESKAATLSAAQRTMLRRMNTSPVRRKKARESHSIGFDRYKYKAREERRFHFDTLDTLPYWYSGAVRGFADLDKEEFLDAAERWIVDRWGVQSNPWRWDDEPRQHRFSDRSLSSWHSHGASPILERFRTHLEWHAMWCAIGELMRTRALAKAGADDTDMFEYRLRGDGLTAPPLWLADLQGPKPLEDRLWFTPPHDINTWVGNAGDDDVLTELGLGIEDGMVVVSSSHETRSQGFMQSVRVETALVSPDTAAALARAIQTIDHPWHYRIPPAGHDLEIDTPPYKLMGWLADEHHDLGIDEHDSLRYGVHAIRYRPAEKAETVLNLAFVYDGQAKWVETGRRRTVFVHEAWGDNRGDEPEERFRYDQSVRSSGSRLRCDKEALRTFLEEIGLDLVVEVEITRRNKGYGYSRYEEEEAKEVRFDKVLILRRDGSIEAAEGCLGTWTVPRA